MSKKERVFDIDRVRKNISYINVVHSEDIDELRKHEPYFPTRWEMGEYWFKDLKDYAYAWHSEYKQKTLNVAGSQHTFRLYKDGYGLLLTNMHESYGVFIKFTDSHREFTLRQKGIQDAKDIEIEGKLPYVACTGMMTMPTVDGRIATLKIVVDALEVQSADIIAISDPKVKERSGDIDRFIANKNPLFSVKKFPNGFFLKYGRNICTNEEFNSFIFKTLEGELQKKFSRKVGRLLFGG